MCKQWMWAAVAVGMCSIGAWSMSDDKAAPADGHAGHGDHAAKPAEGHADGGMDPAMMEAWMKSMSPGEHHKTLEAMAGKFTYTMWFRMDPDQPKQESTGEYDAQIILGGRFLASTVKGDMMGMPFEGMGCLGYDNTLGKYVSGWIDNMSTGLLRTEGTGDGKTLTFAGEMVDPMTGKPTPYKFVYNIKSDDEFSMDWWSPSPAGGEMFQSMSLSYTRAK